MPDRPLKPHQRLPNNQIDLTSSSSDNNDDDNKTKSNVIIEDKKGVNKGDGGTKPDDLTEPSVSISISVSATPNHKGIKDIFKGRTFGVSNENESPQMSNIIDINESIPPTPPKSSSESPSLMNVSKGKRKGTLSPTETDNTIDVSSIPHVIPKEKQTTIRSIPKYHIPRREPTPKPNPKTSKDTNDGKANDVMVDWSDSENNDEDDDHKSVDNNDGGGPSEHDSNPPAKETKRRFRPKLYDFFLNDYDEIQDCLFENEQKFDNNCIIRCPQFATLLDHVIGVLWYFYRGWHYWKDFNVPQLEWTIKFLDGILAPSPYAHIEIIRNQLQELLFIIYTEVPEILVMTPEPKRPQGRPECDPEIPISLKAMFNRAPAFQQYIISKTAEPTPAPEPPPPPPRRKPSSSIATADKYNLARIELMVEEITKLYALTKDPEIRVVIDKLKIHADEILRNQS